MSGQSQPPEVQCLGVSASFDDDVVLHRLDLTVYAGKITTLIGPSGSGKTTLVRHILGLLAPEEGTVTIGGCDVWECTPEQLLRVRKNLSALHSGPTIFEGSVNSSASIRENLLGILYEKYINPPAQEGKPQPAPVANPYLGLWSPHPRARPVTEADVVMNERAQVCLERFDLTEVAELLPVEVAPRTRRRAALACSLVVDVPLYILDDFDGAIDAPNRGRIVDALLDTHKRTGATMLITTHDFALAETISDQVAVLANGRIVAQGEPSRVLDGVESWYTLDEQFPVADFVGPPRTGDRSGDDGQERGIALAIPGPPTIVILIVAMIALIIMAYVLVN